MTTTAVEAVRRLLAGNPRPWSQGRQPPSQEPTHHCRSPLHATKCGSNLDRDYGINPQPASIGASPQDERRPVCRSAKPTSSTSAGFLPRGICRRTRFVPTTATSQHSSGISAFACSSTRLIETVSSPLSRNSRRQGFPRRRSDDVRRAFAASASGCSRAVSWSLTRGRVRRSPSGDPASCLVSCPLMNSIASSSHSGRWLVLTVPETQTRYCHGHMSRRRCSQLL